MTLKYLKKSSHYFIISALLLCAPLSHAASAAAVAANKAIIATLEAKQAPLNYCFELLRLQCATSGTAPPASTIDIKVNHVDGIEYVRNTAKMACVLRFQNNNNVPGQLQDKSIVRAMRPLNTSAGTYDCNSDVVLTNIATSTNLTQQPQVGDKNPLLTAAGFPQSFYSPDPANQTLGATQ